MAGYNLPVVKKCHILKRKQSEYDAPDGPLPPNLSPFELFSDISNNDHFYYGVRIVTGSDVGAATPNKDVYLKLVGSKASTEQLGIASGLFSHMALQSTNDLIIESDADLGEILIVMLGNPSAGAPWFVNFVNIMDRQTKQTVEFPCYHWIDNEDYITFTAKTATLQQVMSNTILVEQRQSQVDQRRLKYTWQIFPDLGMPSAINVKSKNITNDEQFGVVKNIDFTHDSRNTAIKLLAQSALGEIMSLTCMAQFEQLATAMAKPDFPIYGVNSRWRDDEEFGRQMLNGVNPVVIERCSSLPSNFPVTSHMVKGSLDRSTSLDKEMKAGHVYLCNLKILDGLPCREGYYCAAPLCLLYVNKNNHLVPIAIQLKQQPRIDNPIFLPSDSKADWNQAKMYYQSAHAQYHQLVTHYFSCHAVMETYGMAVMRNLPDAHPVYKLLRPHFRYTMAINSRARETLINDGGIIDETFAIGGEGRKELMRRGGAAYNIHCTNIKRSIKERGVDDPKLLPGYYYRDDGLKIWKAIEDFVTHIITEFYSSDADVKDDTELQNWANDLHTIGFPANAGEQGHGFPKTIDSKAQLVELCTLIMFTGSAQHSAINFGQYDMYSFVPNATSGMRSPLPTKKGEADETTLINALPDKITASIVISFAYALSRYGKDEIYLGNFPEVRFTEPNIQDHIIQFQKDLERIEGDIKERNKTLDMPYVYLQPTKVAKSITI